MVVCTMKAKNNEANLDFNGCRGILVDQTPYDWVVNVCLKQGQKTSMEGIDFRKSAWDCFIDGEWDI